MNAYLVTGAPGVGKSTLLGVLSERGSRVMPDAARQFIRERKSIGLPPRPRPAEFAAELFRRDAAQYNSVAQSPRPVFFERGVPDSLGMLSGSGALVPGELERSLAKYSYNRSAFILAPWESIYVQDEERDQSFSEAVVIHEKIARWYLQCGYHLVEVPQGTPVQRCEFVLGKLSA